MRALPLLGVVALVACEAPPGHQLQVASTTAELRPTDSASALMWRYETTDVVESYAADAGAFRVHFTRAGKNAVPLADLDDSGVPDLVEAVSNVYEEVGALDHGPLGYRRPLSDDGLPDNGGDGRFDVYLLDFGLAADGAFRIDSCPTPTQCLGYIVQENDFAGYGYPNATVATRILGSHEYFHAVQSAYTTGGDVVVSEGTAVLATEEFDPSLNDFEGFIGGYLARTDRSIDSPPPGPVPSFAYGSALFFKFLVEKYDAALIRALWEHLEPGQGDPSEPANVANPTWVVQLDALLKRRYSSSFAEAWAQFQTWNLSLGKAADPTKGWANASRYPDVTATSVTLPVQQEWLRIYYASAQFFRVQPGGRAQLVAALVDDPSTAGSELDQMGLVIAARDSSGKNVAVATAFQLSSGQLTTVDLTGATSVLVGVVNTRREANGAILSTRPSLCLGTAEEVDACRFALDPRLAPPDAGLPDAGEPADAGTVPMPTPPSGCGCTEVPVLPALFGVLLVLSRRRR